MRSLSISILAGCLVVASATLPAAATPGATPDTAADRALLAVGQSPVESINSDVVSLDTATVARAVVTTEDGDRLSITASDPASTAVYERADGVQMLTVLERGERSTQFDLGAGVEELVLLPDGGVAVIGADGLPVAAVEAPWAVDANGEPVPTAYSVDGTALTQTFTPTSQTAYPVVVDPYVSTQFSWGLWTHVVSKDVTAKLASPSAQTFAILVAFIPTAGPYIAAMAGVITIQAQAAVNSGKCLLLRAVGSPGNLYWAGTYSGSRCRAS